MNLGEQVEKRAKLETEINHTNKTEVSAESTVVRVERTTQLPLEHTAADKYWKDEDVNLEEYLRDEPFQDITHLAGKLEKLKCVFMKYDQSSDGELDYIAFHAMARDLGIIRPLADLKKRVQDITGNTRDAIPYKDCAMAILGRRSTMCQRIRRFSGGEGEFEKSPCWLDRVYLSYVSHLEFTLSPNLLSPITLLPPPPPPSPADFGVLDKAETYPAA